MSRILGITCIVVAVCVGGWKLATAAFTAESAVPMVHVGDVSVSKDAVLKAEDGALVLIGGSAVSVTKPLVQDVDAALLAVAALASLAAGIVLLRRRPG